MNDSFTILPNLASERCGAAVIAANDEFFAPKENLVRDADPVWREGEYTEHGKWMDGWETRRRRTPGHDWAIVRLGLPGVIRGVVINTRYFTGNYPERASLDCCDAAGLSDHDVLQREDLWYPLLSESPLKGDGDNPFAVASDAQRVTHVRLNIFPDGGVARLRVHGEPAADVAAFEAGEVDLAALVNGGLVISCSDMHYGNPQNMLLPGRSTHMGDGWETRRRRGPGNDWAIIRLGKRGVIERVELDTEHFKGNAPGSCMLECCDAPGAFDADSVSWSELLEKTAVSPHAQHVWDVRTGPATHVRLNIYPDGGVARLRLFGRPA